MIEFEGMANFRDLGGRPVAGGGTVRPGVLYRSDSLAYATAADVDRLITKLRVATVVDLRGEHEVAKRGRGPLADLPVRYVPVPITDVSPGNGDLARHYVAILAERGEPLVGLLRRLVEPEGLPAVVHCEVGCDRTGVVSAAVLGLIGVPDDVIAADYELSADALPAMNERWRQQLIAEGLEPPESTDDGWAEREAAMARTVVAVRERWGGWDGWAREYGLEPAAIERLRELLVE